MRLAPCLLMLVAPVAAAADHPELGVLRDAHATLRINDGAWCDRQIVQLASALGQDPAAFREDLARALYACADISGVDLQRPALRAWRGDQGELAAVIPIADRRAFLASFGVLPAGEPPLVRIADRDGTVVYARTMPDRHEEYHLLISNDTAYLARTAVDCRAMAADPLALAGDDVAVAYTAWAPFPDSCGAGVPLLLPAALALPTPLLHAPPALDALLTLARQDLLPAWAAQVSGWSWQLHEHPNAAEITVAADIPAESALGTWLHGQTPQPLTALAAVPPSAVVAIAGACAWLGQADAERQALTTRAQVQAGSHWTPPVAESWRASGAAIEQIGGWGLLLSLPAANQPVWSFSCEHPQPAVLAGELSTLLSGWSGKDATAGPATGESVIAGEGAECALLPTERHLLLASGPSGRAVPALDELVAVKPDADPDPGHAPTALLALRWNLSREIQVLYGDRLDDPKLPPAMVEALVTPQRGQLTAHATIPIGDLCAALNKVNWK